MLNRFLDMIRALPTPLLYVIAAFSVFPYAGWVWIESPVAAYLSGGTWRFLLIIISYWILPLMICYLAFTQRFSLILTFFVECSFLLVHSVITRQEIEIPVIEFLLAVSMMLFSFVFLRRDTIYPLLASQKRTWRKNPRLNLLVPVRLWFPQHPEDPFSVVLENWSLTGIGFSAPSEVVESFLGSITNQKAFELKIDIAGDAWKINASIMHSSHKDGRGYVGIYAMNAQAMRQLLSVLSKKYHHSWFLRYWASEGFHHAALLCCGIGLSVILISPSCSKDNQNKIVTIQKPYIEPVQILPSRD